MAELITRVYSNFRGVDFRGEEINLMRSPDSLNVWKDYKETESIRTRPEMVIEKAFLEPLSCCLRAVRRAGFEYGVDNSKQSALVIGLGSIGLLMLKALRSFKVDAYGFDISQKRALLAAQHGFCYQGNKKYDTIFLTAGSDKAIKTALEHVVDGGKIIVFSSVKDDLAGFSNNEIYYRELSIISSYSPSVDDIKLSAELLNNKIVLWYNICVKSWAFPHFYW